MIGGRVLDLSALLSFARQNSLYAAALVWTAVEEDIVLLTPATAVGLAWAQLDGVARPVLDVLLGLPIAVVDDLTRSRSLEVGEYLASHRIRLDAAHAAVCARERGWPLVTAEPAEYDDAEGALVVETLP